MRLCLVPTSKKPSSLNSRPWRPSKLSVVRPVVGWRNGLDPSVCKEHLACHIEARHQTEREPHLLRLADLHQQRIAVTKSPRWPTRTVACAKVRSQGAVQISEPHEYQRIIRTRHRDGTDLGLPRGRGLCR